MKKNYFICLLLFIQFSVHGQEIRCGWLDNPTPGNLWLIDRDAEWSISQQGGHESEGIEKIIDNSIDPSEIIYTNGNYGVRCACLSVEVDNKSKTIIKIYSFDLLKIKQCRDDKKIQHFIN
ncbi:DUF4087 domain-containing protein [Providencia stuartii]|uniref:DUF4087 domain-containing protein n=2 Tax=Providencia stuartii TaxID=588 RepID=A0AAI9HZJ9_PROST|nr:DUF4087 domain-containing protein [Providencia sp. PROV152]ELR5035554.1 DUF4087 domain-containing protein [Providencia stuartii]ELZ5938906.1 DUF4087 domain-containing protein [Providencia stuartii]